MPSPSMIVTATEHGMNLKFKFATWSAPAAFAAIGSVGPFRTSGSTWHVIHAPGKPGHFLAGHFALTGEGDPLQGWAGTGRTPGRALRRIRRRLKRNPVLF